MIDDTQAALTGSRPVVAADHLLRPYQPGDLEKVLAIWLSANRMSLPRLTEAFLSAELAQVRDVYLPKAEVWVAAQADHNRGHITGFMALMGYQLAGLFIAPAHQGTGIGQALIARAIAERGDLEVDVFEANQPARNLYTRSGFVPADDYIHAATGHRVLRLTRLA